MREKLYISNAIVLWVVAMVALFIVIHLFGWF